MRRGGPGARRCGVVCLLTSSFFQHCLSPALACMPMFHSGSMAAGLLTAKQRQALLSTCPSSSLPPPPSPCRQLHSLVVRRRLGLLTGTAGRGPEMKGGEKEEDDSRAGEGWASAEKSKVRWRGVSPHCLPAPTLRWILQRALPYHCCVCSGCERRRHCGVVQGRRSGRGRAPVLWRARWVGRACAQRACQPARPLEYNVFHHSCSPR